jgi:outer membrane autotransporter protein
LPTPVPGAGAIRLERPEVALRAALPSVARSAGRTTLGTFHDREGEQAFASGDGAFQAGWARVFGGSYQQSWSGDVSPAFSGSVFGVQAGLPFFGWDHSNGEKDRAGVFGGYTSATGSVTGFADGQQGFAVGSLGLNAYSVGLYGTHFWPAGGYLDVVLMQSWITSTTNSARNVSTASNGRIGTASLEMGYPIPVWSGWAIEPQAQFIFQHWGDDLLNDLYAQVSTVENNAFISRFGLRLTGNLVRDKMVIKPFALVNLWRDFGGQDTIAFNQTSIATNQSVTAMEFGAGMSASVGTWTDVYAKVSYTTDIDGNFQSSFTGRLGFRLTW